MKERRCNACGIGSRVDDKTVCHDCLSLIRYIQKEFEFNNIMAFRIVKEGVGLASIAIDLAKDATKEVEEAVKARKAEQTKYSPMDYHQLEHATTYIPLYALVANTFEEELHLLRELLDVALLGNDISWAKELHKHIKNVEGAMNNEK